MESFLNLFLHLDEALKQAIIDYGNWIYVIMFAIIFIETGLIVMPFLPGDSLLFAAGLFASYGDLNIALLLGLLFVAAVLGDAVNYSVGKKLGLRATKFKLFGKNLVKQEHLDRTHEFYEKYGPKAIIIARFVPIVRTFAPFVAGVGSMTYKKFATYNVLGAFLWVFGVTLVGYLLGEIKWVQENFKIIVFGIILISVVPIIYEFLKQRFAKK